MIDSEKILEQLGRVINAGEGQKMNLIYPVTWPSFALTGGIIAIVVDILGVKFDNCFVIGLTFYFIFNSKFILRGVYNAPTSWGKFSK